MRVRVWMRVRVGVRVWMRVGMRVRVRLHRLGGGRRHQGVSEGAGPGNAQTRGYQPTDEVPSVDPPGQVTLYEFFLVRQDAHPC
jgi:hypothetical protein